MRSKRGDAVETRSFYTVEQLAAFMDVEVDMDHEILVNNRVATMESLVYENFSVDWVVLFRSSGGGSGRTSGCGAACDGCGWRDGADSGRDSG